ncbi:MAG: hypothetical protein U0694_06565 [Anaerolineae bacterium]
MLVPTAQSGRVETALTAESARARCLHDGRPPGRAQAADLQHKTLVDILGFISTDEDYTTVTVPSVRG